MRRFFSLLLIASVMAHATFGCCLHHTHASEVNCHDATHEHGLLSSPGHNHASEAVESSKSAGLHSPQAIAAEQGEALISKSDHQHVPCSDAKCSFARTELITSYVALAASDYQAVAVFPELAHEPAAAFARQSLFSGFSVVSLTLRRHLVLAVLVV